jgi:hypothetical protein
MAQLFAYDVTELVDTYNSVTGFTLTTGTLLTDTTGNGVNLAGRIYNSGTHSGLEVPGIELVTGPDNLQGVQYLWYNSDQCWLQHGTPSFDFDDIKSVYVKWAFPTGIHTTNVRSVSFRGKYGGFPSVLTVIRTDLKIRAFWDNLSGSSLLEIDSPIVYDQWESVLFTYDSVNGILSLQQDTGTPVTRTYIAPVRTWDTLAHNIQPFGGGGGGLSAGRSHLITTCSAYDEVIAPFIPVVTRRQELGNLRHRSFRR